MKPNDDYQFFKYNDYWQNSLQRIESLTKDIEKHINSLEKKYYDFDAVYNEITIRIGILASIYSNYNNLKGGEYLLKLKALLNNYKKKYSGTGIDFKTIHFLNLKINKLRDASFQNFPGMNHTFYSNVDHFNKKNFTTDGDIEKYNSLKASAKYKWISFKRNGSWFITSCDKFKILNAKSAEILNNNNLKKMLNFENNSIEITDVFSKFKGTIKEEINYYIILKNNGSLKCYAASKLGRILMSDKNFIRPFLKALTNNRIASGRFRIFGKNHLYLDLASAEENSDLF